MQWQGKEYPKLPNDGVYGLEIDHHGYEGIVATTTRAIDTPDEAINRLLDGQMARIWPDDKDYVISQYRLRKDAYLIEKYSKRNYQLIRRAIQWCLVTIVCTIALFSSETQNWFIVTVLIFSFTLSAYYSLEIDS